MQPSQRSVASSEEIFYPDILDVMLRPCLCNKDSPLLSEMLRLSPLPVLPPQSLAEDFPDEMIYILIYICTYSPERYRA